MTLRKEMHYRVAGLPVAIRGAVIRYAPTALDRIRQSYARAYWRPGTKKDAVALVAAILYWPVYLGFHSARYTLRNGHSIRARTGKSLTRQWLEQIFVYLKAGILPKWNDIFGLNEHGSIVVARQFLNRFETKRFLFKTLTPSNPSPVSNKASFENHCRKHGLPAVAVLLDAAGGTIEWRDPVECLLPPRDLFIKPSKGKGGTGAERWDYAGDGAYRHTSGVILTDAQLLEEIVRRSSDTPLIVQPRMVNHQDLREISNGALCTVRILTCLDEQDRPQLISAALRMAVGANVTVDNFHAGGIAAAIEPMSGTLSSASNLGQREDVGWISHHPDTGGLIEGRRLPLWPETKTLVLKAHDAFSDRVVIGWDVAITNEGPLLVEANGSPDVDILQRASRTPLGAGPLVGLLAFHLERVSSEKKAKG